MLSFYAVRVGVNPGVYESWPECREQVHRVPGSVFRKFSTRSAAEAFLNSSAVLAEAFSSPHTQAADIYFVDEVRIYTDGSCPRNAGAASGCVLAGWGLVVEAANDVPSEDFYGPVILDLDHPHFLGATRGTNNTAELSAMGMALVWLLRNKESRRPARILFDSLYAANVALGIYRPKANPALAARVQDLLALVRGSRAVAFEHVTAHAKNAGNNRADRNAARGAAGETLHW